MLDPAKKRISTRGKFSKFKGRLTEDPGTESIHESFGELGICQKKRTGGRGTGAVRKLGPGQTAGTA